MRYPWGARWNHSRAANRRVGCRPGKAVGTSRPKLSTQPRPELRPQAGPEVRREPTRSPMLPRLCWCAARSIEAMHAPAVKLHHLAAQFYLTLAPTRHSTQLRPVPAFEIAHGADSSRTRPAPDLRACITHAHAACLALPCLRLRYPTLLLTNFRSRGLTLTVYLQVPFTSTPTAHYHHHHHHRPRHPPTLSHEGPAPPPSALHLLLPLPRGPWEATLEFVSPPCALIPCSPWFWVPSSRAQTLVVVIGPLSEGHTHKTADRPIIPSSLTPPLNIVHLLT